MNFRNLKTTLLAAAFVSASLLAACGGGGGSSATSAPAAPGSTPTGATTTSVVTSGPITAFGSVFVNGQRFDTSAAQIEVEGQSATQAQLKVGDVVELKGSRRSDGSATAARIVRRSAVRGPISAIDATTNRITILGQTVLVTAATSFDDSISPADLSGLKVDDVVEVHGLPNASAQIEATRIEKAAAGAVWKVVGKAASTDTTNRKLSINALVVNYATATLSDFASGAPADGDIVEAKGTSLNASKELVATSLENVGAKRMRPDDANGEVEVEGYVTRFVSATDFDVANRAVTTTASTTYEGGTASDLKLNARVEAEGALNASGVLVAAKIKFRTQANVRLRGTVDAIGTAATTVTVLGIETTVNAMTRLEDRTANRSQFFKFADLKTGDTVEIRGYESPANSGRIVALRLERVPAGTTSVAFLRGPIRTAATPNFTILNVNVATTATTQFRASGSTTPLTQAQFFATANLVGQTASAVGTFAGGTVTATRVELNDHDD